MNSKQTKTIANIRALVQQPAQPNLYSYVRTCRVVRGLNQADIAALVGVSRATIQNIERNRVQPSVFVALKLAQVLNTTVENLFEIRYILPKKHEYPKVGARFNLPRRDFGTKTINTS